MRRTMRACVPRFKSLKLTSPISVAAWPNVCQGLAMTTDPAREILEKIVTDSRTAGSAGRRAPRSPSCDDTTRRNAPNFAHHVDRPGPLSSPWVRTELDAKCHRCCDESTSTMNKSCCSRTHELQQHRVLQLTGVSHPGGLADGAGVSPSELPELRQVRDEYLWFEVNIKM